MKKILMFGFVLVMLAVFAQAKMCTYETRDGSIYEVEDATVTIDLADDSLHFGECPDELAVPLRYLSGEIPECTYTIDYTGIEADVGTDVQVSYDEDVALEECAPEFFITLVSVTEPELRFEYATLQPGQEVRIDIDRPVTALDWIFITMEEDIAPVENAAFRVVPDQVAYEDGPVFDSFTIETDNVDQGDIQTAVLNFKVSKDWMQGQGLQPSDITLKARNGAWEDVYTKIVGETESRVHYETRIGVLTDYVVGTEDGTAADGQQGTQQPDNQQPEVAGDSESQQTAEPVDQGITGEFTEEVPEELTSETAYWVLGIGLVVVAAIVLALLLRRR